ncbi:MAG: hypothetical protein DCC67_18995 [Planctomycetota bacterium]|nr:MAG: hypothetical protein DCC67_18995 [Planctomycetota bacterium]
MRGMTANGDLIRALRRAQGLTQEQLADKAGLDVKTVRSAEQRKRLDGGSVMKLSSVLQTEMRQLIVRPRRGSRGSVEISRRNVVLDWLRAFNDHDADRLMRCYHAEATVHLPGAPHIPFGGVFRGGSNIRRAAQAAWPYCRREAASQQRYAILTSGDTVVVEGRKHLRKPDGGVWRLHFTHVFRFSGELIIEQQVEYDTLRFAQLALFPLAHAPAQPLAVDPPSGF